jgi:glucosamine-6-phosphate deaminase
LFAWGEKKASIVAESINGVITDQVPATFLQKHNNTVFILDKAASVVTA